MYNKINYNFCLDTSTVVQKVGYVITSSPCPLFLFYATCPLILALPPFYTNTRLLLKKKKKKETELINSQINIIGFNIYF
jgi:hypothetical protein